MSRSDIKEMGSEARTAFRFLFVSLAMLVFGMVYEVFSHGVYSKFMIFAFVFPLVGGALPFFGFALAGKKIPAGVFKTLYTFGIATLTTGSLMQGALDIYGTTNGLMPVYWNVGAGLMLAGIAGHLIKNIKNTSHDRSADDVGCMYLPQKPH